ncbi:MAG: hypothetical protein KKF48_03585 [Nanoarchaeota archaeon]|nr:hypothetical protein [Nanoarchaeota archaeon]MBU1028101.1 hypothetical protein [Nanoarchaeota archaeon]
MSKNITVTCLTEEYSIFHYFFFYSEKYDLSVYSEFGRSLDGNFRIFEVGKGKEYFNANYKRFSDEENKTKDVFSYVYKWSCASIPELDKTEIKNLENFLKDKKKRIIKIPEKNIGVELEFLIKLDKKILGAKR